MTEKDNRFFEKYKKLNSLCSDMFSCNNGVSKYIEEMEKIPYKKKCGISFWDSDYKDLKHLRWVRNQIAHDTGSSFESFSDENDFEKLCNFYNRILNLEDPISLAEKQYKAKTKIIEKSIPFEQTKKVRPEEKPVSPVLTFLIVGMAVIFFIVLIISFFL